MASLCCFTSNKNSWSNGNSRTYENICLLRAVISEDGMSADYFNFPKNFLDIISNKIVNNVKGINRVVYDITSKPQVPSN